MTTSWMAYAGLALVLLASAAGALRRTAAGIHRRRRVTDVAAKPLMSANEFDFFHTLRAALPDGHVLAQVSFGALLRPEGPKPNTPEWWSNRNRFGQKVADYVFVDRDGAVVAVIELDDRTHDAVKDAKRDALLASAGIAVVRYQSRAKPDPARIRRDLRLPATPRTGLIWG